MINPNDPAFGHMAVELRESALQQGREPREIHYQGLTKREYFAAMAMMGKIGQDNCSIDWAHECVHSADMLIAELNK